MVSKDSNLDRTKKQRLFTDNVSVHNENIFSTWLLDVESEPHLAKIVHDSSRNFVSDSKSLLQELVASASSYTFPELESKDIQPFFKLWHKILREQTSKGMTLKSLGLSIFSLKKTLSRYMENVSLDNRSRRFLNRLSQLLDFVGLFTFEVYSAEQEDEINQQNEQIEYLQSNFFSSHRLAEIQSLCDDLAIIHKGELYFNGTYEEFESQKQEATLEDEFIRMVGEGEHV